MTRLAPAQRTALFSVFAAVGLVAIKLIVGLVANSLALIAEAAHSGTDVIAALLTFFAVGVAGRPADAGHQFGHGKAEHLSALGEGGILVIASLAIAYEAIVRLVNGEHEVKTDWYVFAVVVGVIVIDLSRMLASRQRARELHSAALGANALHFGLDMLGSVTVLVGLLLVRAGYPNADSVAALLVAALVLVSAGRLMRNNVAVLMDTAPEDSESRARDAIESIDVDASLRRLRIREAGGRHFADVVVGVPADAGVAHGHAVASAIEEAIEAELPGSDVVVHVEPEGDLGPLRQRATAAALSVPDVREIHNVTALRVGEGTEFSLHLKVPADMTLDAAHAIADEVEHAIREAVPSTARVLSHIEPLTDEAAGLPISDGRVHEEDQHVRDVVREVTGADPRELRFRNTEQGLLAFLTLALPHDMTLVDAHETASEVERRIRDEQSSIFDVVVHTEPV
jgi:cation diffusion facilitator family transporter